MTRFVALDIHKDYFTVVGVNANQSIVLEAKRIFNKRLREWVTKKLLPTDHVVLEMTTNAYLFHDILCPLVASVTVVHPPNVPAVTNAPVKTDLKAAHTLAILLAANVLKGVWIPPQEIRDQRQLVAQRIKMTRMETRAKNRLHAILHRHHIDPPDPSDPFHPKHADWWANLPIPLSEQVIVQCDWNTLCFAVSQLDIINDALKAFAATDERVPLLTQLPGAGWFIAVAVLSAVGDITRFQTPGHLVGYAGLGARVHESGKRSTRGRITKRGRKELRWAMVQAARKAINSHPKWKPMYERLEPRIGRNKAIVAIARRMLVAVWHILTDETYDRHGNPEKIAAGIYRAGYKIGMEKIKAANPQCKTGRYYVDYHLRRMRIRHRVSRFKEGDKFVNLPA